MKVLRSITVAAEPLPTRLETFKGKDWLAVPVVMIMEGVVFPMGAESPEFVPAAELAKVPSAWDGRPVCMNHPAVEGERATANTPVTLETASFGQLFNTEMKDTKLTSEAWFELDQVPNVEGAQDILDRVEAGEMIEVSVGCWVELEDVEGEFNGKKFNGSWKNIVPDHLAMLEEGTIGACSNEMGCGTRLARVHSIKACSMELLSGEEQDMAREKNKVLALRKNHAALEVVVREGKKPVLTDNDLRQRLERALGDESPTGFLWLDSVSPSEGLVVYSAFADEDSYKVDYWQRAYTVADDGTVQLAAEKVAMLKMDKFVTAEEAAAAADAPKPPCGCGKTKEAKDTKMTKAERISALINAKRSPFAEADRKVLEGFDDDRLAKLQEDVEAEPEPVAPAGPAEVPAVVPPAEEPKAKTTEEYVAEAPADVREALQEGIRAASARKATAISLLKGSGRCKFSDVELGKKSLNELDQLVELAGVKPSSAAVDYSLNAGAPRAAASQTEAVPPPPSITERLAEQRKLTRAN